MKEHKVLVSEDIADACKEMFLELVQDKDTDSYFMNFNDVVVIMVNKRG